jgi:hypothetical protein
MLDLGFARNRTPGALHGVGTARHCVGPIARCSCEVFEEIRPERTVRKTAIAKTLERPTAGRHRLQSHPG